MDEGRRARWRSLLSEAAARRDDPFRPGDGGPDPAAPVVDAQVIRRDLERVFGRGWLAVCRESDVPVGSWRRVDVGRARILVTRTEAGLHAMANVCPHRGVTLVSEACGRTERLRCPYHGLGWGLDGSLVSAPPALGMGPDVRPGSVSLPRFRVDAWGGWVFVCQAADGPSLTEFLGDLPAQLDGWPLAQAERKFHETFEVPFGWRLAVEGFLEALHLPLLHPKTVYPFVNPAVGAADTFGDHSIMLGAWRLPGLYESDGAVGRGAARAGVEVFPGLDEVQRGHNFTALLFPNVTLNLLPNHFTTTVAWPIDEARTRIELDLFGLPTASEAGEAWFAGIIENHRAIGREDFAMLARAHEGLAAGHLTSLFRSSYDQRIRHFYRRLEAWHA